MQRKKHNKRQEHWSDFTWQMVVYGWDMDEGRIQVGDVKRDPYVLGVMCAKAGLVTYALETRKTLDVDYPDRIDAHYVRGELRERFIEGAEFAPYCSLSDVACELRRCRQSAPRTFDHAVEIQCGQWRVAEIISAIEAAGPEPKFGRYDPIARALESLAGKE
jgi:hypothetical protein